MSETLTITALNTARGLDNHQRKHQLTEHLSQVAAQSDIIIISEATRAGALDNDIARFASDGNYGQAFFSYNDKREHPGGKQYMLVMYRGSSVKDVSTIRLGTRNAVKISTPRIDVIGLHADDRSNIHRQGILNALPKYLNGGKATILGGDLNSLHKNDWHAKLIRNPIIQAALMETINNLPNKERSERLHHLASRLGDMASGKTMQQLANMGFRDADPRYRPTMMLGPLGVGQLDHFMYKGPLKLEKFTRHPRCIATDHRGISATFSVAHQGN